MTAEFKFRPPHKACRTVRFLDEAAADVPDVADDAAACPPSVKAEPDEEDDAEPDKKGEESNIAKELATARSRTAISKAKQQVTIPKYGEARVS